MRLTRIVGWVIVAVAFVFWFTAIAGATASGSFENQGAVQLMILGGAISMIAGLVLQLGDW